MNEKIKTQLRVYLDLKLRLCKAYMREQDLTMAREVWQQAIGAVEFTSVSTLSLYPNTGLSAEIDVMWEMDYQDAFEKTLFPEVEV